MAKGDGPKLGDISLFFSVTALQFSLLSCPKYLRPLPVIGTETKWTFLGLFDYLITGSQGRNTGKLISVYVDPSLADSPFSDDCPRILGRGGIEHKFAIPCSR